MNRRKSKEYIKALEAQLAQHGITVLQKYGWYGQDLFPNSVIFYDGERIFRMNLDGSVEQVGNSSHSEVLGGSLSRLDFNEVRLFLQDVIENNLFYKIGTKIAVKGSELGRPILYKNYATSPVSIVGNLVTYYDVPLFDIETREWSKVVVSKPKPKAGQYVIAKLKNDLGVSLFYVNSNVEICWNVLDKDIETYKVLEGDDPIVVMMHSQLNS